MTRSTLSDASFRWTFRAAALLVVAATISAGTATAGVPVIVAVDTSRSLSARQLGLMTDRVQAVAGTLPPDTAFGLMAFDDSPRWVVEPPATSADVEAGLAALTPAGNFTLLNDALFTAARTLPDGGVILLLTDGRDENSATTVDDVAALCRANHVRIVSLSTGRTIDEKALRRLALLTEGEYLGSVNEASAPEVGADLARIAGETAAEVEAARPPEPSAEIEVTPRTAPTTTPVVRQEAPWWLLPLLLFLIIAVLITLFVLWRWRQALVKGPKRPLTPDWETDPAFESPEAGDAAKEPTVDLPPAPPMDERAEELSLDPSAFQRLPFDGDIDTTSVLDEQHILSVMEPGQEIRSFRLRGDRAFAVGRAPGVNTLVLESRSLSGQHFKIVPHDGGFAVVDLDSTNGTLVNGRKIRARHLEASDTIRAGEVEFEFKVILKSLM